MSYLSEEEIIKKANEFINTLNEIIYDESDWYDYEELESAKEQLPVIQGLLKLYEEEKEKNKKIKDASLMVVGRRSGKEYAQKLVLEEYIHKDKIRDLLEEIKNEKLNYSESEYYLESEIKGYAIDKFKELLEED